MSNREDYGGVHPIIPTAFTDNGVFDEESQRRLIEFMIDVGVNGVAILGFLGEAHKLSSSERRRVIEVVSRAVAGRIKILVGVRALGTAEAIEQAVEARELGADAVFAAPLGVQNDAVLFDYYQELAERSRVPVMIHDFPESFGTILSVPLISRLANEVDGVVGVKAEEPPVLIKLSQILEKSPNLAVLGGLGGVYFLEELGRGAAGIMTGFAFPEVLVKIYEQFRSGDYPGAASTFDKYMPLIRFEFQPKLGLAFRKYNFKRRGIFRSDYIRSPGMRLDAGSQEELEALVARVGLSLDERLAIV